MSDFSTKDMQFFPTPAELASRMWGKFKNKDIQRMLEPSCGNGDLVRKMPDRRVHRHGEQFSEVAIERRGFATDACELDVTKHPVLKALGINVVGFDFLDFTTGAPYSHVLMNPPFSQGAKHVLHAWEILWDGEIVALLNAETLRNAFSAERQLLARIIEQHGEVEFVEGAFTSPETMRKTEVECAIVYLKKTADRHELLIGLLDGLKTDGANEEEEQGGYREMHDLALPRSIVENQVIVFDLAVKAAKEAVLAGAKASAHAGRLGKTLTEHDDGRAVTTVAAEVVRKQLADRYLELKDRAWTSILRGSEVTSRLTYKAQKRVEAEFEQIKQLEFTTQNIYGFLLGIAESADEIQMSMACDVFDEIVRYHSENTVFFRGWKSNDAHRTMGMRIKARRFILPNFDIEKTRKWLSFEDRKRLEDLDRVFAMLDGKTAPECSLVQLFEKSMRELMAADRMSTSYFDVRAFAGVKTVHFFPKRADLMDRLNRVVGQRRQWLPDSPMPEAKDFWRQYDQAEKFDAELRAAVKKAQQQAGSFPWIGPLGVVVNAACDRRGFGGGEVARALDVVTEAVMEVHQRHGIEIDRLVGSTRSPLRLAA